MSYKVTVKKGDTTWNSSTSQWEDSDRVMEYEDIRLTNALAEFLYAVDDGEKVTLSYKPPKVKSKK